MFVHSNLYVTQHKIFLRHLSLFTAQSDKKNKKKQTDMWVVYDADNLFSVF